MKFSCLLRSSFLFMVLVSLETWCCLLLLNLLGVDIFYYLDWFLLPVTFLGYNIITPPPHPPPQTHAHTDSMLSNFRYSLLLFSSQFGLYHNLMTYIIWFLQPTSNYFCPIESLLNTLRYSYLYSTLLSLLCYRILISLFYTFITYLHLITIWYLLGNFCFWFPCLQTCALSIDIFWSKFIVRM